MGCGNAGVTKHLPGGPDTVEERFDVGFGHPFQPVASRGALVHHDLVELRVLGRESHESTYPVGKCRRERWHVDAGELRGYDAVDRVPQEPEQVVHRGCP